MKKYIYKLKLEDGQEFPYTLNSGIMFNAKEEDGSEVSMLITSAILLESIDVVDAPVVIEAENAAE